jgi:phenylacetate-CoA ligase
MGRGSFRRALATATWHAHPAPRGRTYRFLQRSQWLSGEELERVQLAALNDVLAAARKIPFHRARLEEAAVGPRGVRSLEELAALPPLERADLQRLGIAGLRRPGRLVIHRRTSGSTGEPVETVWPLEMMAWVDAADRRSLEWLGIGLGDRRLYVRTPSDKSRALRRLKSALMNGSWVTARRLGEPRYREAVFAALEQRPPALVIGNAKSTATLAHALGARRIDAKAVVTSAGRLDEHYRAVVERVFHCPVFERYGTIELGLLSHPCREAGAQHLPAELILMEIVRDDGTPAAPGEVGDVLVTTLRNRTMPLIRYRLGDLAALAAGECSCGRGLPVLQRLVGRTNELLATADGRVLLPGVVVDTLMAIARDSLLEFKVVQQEDLSVEIRIVQRDVAHAAAHRRRLAEAFDGLIGVPGGTVVKRLPDIPADRAEKLLVITSHAVEAGRGVRPI